MEAPMADRPAKFFKYRSMDAASVGWVEKTVLHHELYFAPAKTFNDPFDLRPVIALDATPEQHRERYLATSRKFEPELSEDERQAQADQAMAASMNPGEIEKTAALIQSLHAEALTNSCGVFCVSAKRDDILMWSHYADFHRGICLEFDGTGPLMAHAHEVQYSDDRPPLNPYNDDADTMMRKALLTKSRHWSYECEWRLLAYARGPGIETYRPLNLTGIVIGAMASNATIDTIREWAKRRESGVSLYRASTSTKRFELEIKAFS